jgi:hypothetical protein
MNKPAITEARAEAMADRLVWKRLATDSAYRNAENAEAQADREERISEEVWNDLQARYTIED